MEGKIYRPLKGGEVLTADAAVRRRQLEMHGSVTSLRQAAEWGMRSIQGSFPRLKATLTEEKFRRFRIIECAVRLHNLRTRLVGINQIRTVFDPMWTPSLFPSKSYDRLARYYHIEVHIDGVDSDEDDDEEEPQL